jgi:hypothetical protein
VLTVSCLGDIPDADSRVMYSTVCCVGDVPGADSRAMYSTVCCVGDVPGADSSATPTLHRDMPAGLDASQLLFKWRVSLMPYGVGFQQGTLYFRGLEKKFCIPVFKVPMLFPLQISIGAYFLSLSTLFSL